MPSSKPLNILIVEDDAILAVELASIAGGLGHNVIGIAIDKNNAMQMSAQRHVDVALVDLNLNDGPTGASVARFMVREHAASVIFVTGSVEQIPDDFCGALGVVPKPYDANGFTEVFDFATALRDSVTHAPRHLTVAPWLRRACGRPGADPALM